MPCTPTIALDQLAEFKYEQRVSSAQRCMTHEELVSWADGKVDDSARQYALLHIADCEDCRQAVSALVRIEVEPSVALGDTLTGSPEMIGRFVIKQVLGRGGMGMVVAAFDPLLDRQVAIKVVSASADGDQLREFEARLAREAQVLAKFRHANVVAVHEAGRDGDRLYMVMDLVEGQTLRAWLVAQRPSWHEAIAMVAQAGAGLSALHAAGVIHRDIKPDNIMVDTSGKAIVVDLGLAHRTGTENKSQTLTKSGAVIGTPRYMAPEQMAGDPVDARCDQYAFAATLLHAMRAGGQEPPANIRAAVAKAMDPEPAARFTSIDSLLHAVTMPAQSKRRRAVAAIATAAVITIAGTGIWMLRRGHAESAAQIPTTISATQVQRTPTVAVVAPAAALVQVPAAAAAPIANKNKATTSRDLTAAKVGRPALAVSDKTDPAPEAGTDSGKILAELRKEQLATVEIAESLMPLYCSSGIADWGQVVRTGTAEVSGVNLIQPHATLMYEVEGQKSRYIFDGQSVGFRRGLQDRLTLRAKVGDWVMLCGGDSETPYHFSNTWDHVGVINVYAPIAGPPAFSKRTPVPQFVRSPKHLVGRNKGQRFWQRDQDTVILFNARLPDADSNGVVAMEAGRGDEWRLEIPSSTPGAELVSGNKQLWVSATFSRFVVEDDHQIPIFKAAYIEVHLFAKP
jgi:hypothetical protein